MNRGTSFRVRTVIVIEELVAGSEDGRPSLADDLRSGRDRDCVRHHVHTGVEEDDLAARVLSTARDRELISYS